MSSSMKEDLLKSREQDPVAWKQSNIKFSTAIK